MHFVKFIQLLGSPSSLRIFFVLTCNHSVGSDTLSEKIPLSLIFDSSAITQGGSRSFLQRVQQKAVMTTVKCGLHTKIQHQ